MKKCEQIKNVKSDMKKTVNLLYLKTDLIGRRERGNPLI